MKYLIINADDFGKFESINDGIIEGINAGVITSTSLMVHGLFAKDIDTIKDNPSISIGLHFVVPSEDKSNIESEFLAQVELFKELVGRKPDHIDSHKVRLQELPEIKEILADIVRVDKIPLRDSGYAHFIEDFFALSRLDFKTIDNTKVSPSALIDILNTKVVDGYNELMCHAGRVDEQVRLGTTYSDPREVELNTLLSQDLRDYFNTNPDIKLGSCPVN